MSTYKFGFSKPNMSYVQRYFRFLRLARLTGRTQSLEGTRCKPSSLPNFEPLGWTQISYAIFSLQGRLVQRDLFGLLQAS